MGNMIKSFGVTFGAFRKDKILILLSMVPIAIGAMIYSIAGKYIYGDLLTWGENKIKETISSGTWGEFLTWIILGVISVLFYFIVSWTFVLVVSFFAAPFNDLMSSRVEKVFEGQQPDPIGKGLAKIFSRISFIIFNESKKIIFILFVTIIGFALSFFPMLAPVSIIISAILLSVGFVDYSWARHDLDFRKCLSDVRRNFIGYSLAGFIFLVLITIPGVNLLTLPFAVVYFTVLFCKNRESGKTLV